MSASTPSAATAQCAKSQPPSIGRILRECGPIVCCHRGWLVAAVATSTAYGLLEPVQGLVVKRVVDGLRSPAADAAAIVYAAMPQYAAILLGLGLLSFVEKYLKGVYDPRLVFELQRRYLERRPRIDEPVDVTRLQYDCMYGRKALEVFARDVVRIVSTVAVALGFQSAFAPQWLPALALITASVAAATLVTGIAVTRSNQRMFDAVEPVARCVRAKHTGRLEKRQQVLYRRIRSREAWMGASEVVVQLLLWGGCLAVIGFASRKAGSDSPEADLGGLALFVANLQIISRPLVEIGKAYNKFCSNIPALRRTLFPTAA
ncbi:MAG: ABC transporter ATP-binding protein [Planctomycetes bacterium]|nr:ABC transporter ATP-binding protein [Planctomycetota bacterium]